jgi:photosystem II stability/assembly factor-like uncharacterized protein
MPSALHTPRTSTAGRNARRLGLGVLLTLLTPTLPAADLSEKAALAAHALLLDVAAVEGRLVAVGDRGHVLVSADQGATWEQILVPTRAMLTAVAFADTNHGTAVGHDGVILATADGGRSWQRRDHGQDLDTVWFDVLFVDARHGFIAGAYGKFLRTEDGGQTWTPAKPTSEDLHFYRISAGAGRLYLAGESGTALASADGGATWERLEVPYDGSLYGILPLDDSNLLAYGLRGHIFRSTDAGVSWEPVDNPVTVLIMGGTRLADGTIILGGLGGNLFVSRDGGRSFQHWHPAELGTGVAEVVAAGTDRIVTVGEGGAHSFTLPR